MPKQFTLGKSERLKSRKSIEQLFSEGKKIMISPYRVLYRLETTTDEPGMLFGTGVSVKNFKRAVDRNKIKRLTREAYRLQKTRLQQKMITQKKQLHVFFIYTSKELPDFPVLYDKMESILAKLDKLAG